MRLGQFSTTADGPAWCGAVVDDSVVNLSVAGEAAGVSLPEETAAVLGQWNWEEKVSMAVEYATEHGVGVEARDDLVQHEPVSDPQKIVCVGLNYIDHAEESGQDVPEEPMLFSKFPTCVNGPGGEITWDPEYTEQVDYEAELVLVVGREARDVDAADARDHIAGLTVGNDVSARDLQLSDEQWVRGKSLDTFAPIGPELVTLDEVDDPHGLDVWTELDGERLQDSSTSNLIFGIDELVAFCSRAFTLEPGDLVFTGTPPGVGVFRDPKVLLDDGDEITVGVEGVGELTNVCRHR
ncbi:fumarylacetoacetate hydrolase family protein [Salinigranum halophilum]|uniref:fumarylacetoacetate hydrolase family protein n=1 Tax=Salinigranum halophilum TaxID=2565931 RepID=UPI0010A7FA71|nr:fumarylacetoacetate hydrolase family protein [Salinigranum halophilum]